MLRRRVGFAAVVLVVVAVLLLNLNCSAPLRVEPLVRTDRPWVVDEQLELARRYAPVLYKAIHGSRGRQDLPTRVDFDGNLRGDDNWENLPRYELPPAALYAVLSTESHHFLTYHLFHPRDWAPARLGLNDTHENDGENLAVVVERSSGRVVLLTTQAHYCGRSYAAEGAGFADGRQSLAGELLLLDERGVPAPDGTHAAVFVQSQGHGIYGALDGCSEVSVADDGTARFDDSGLVFRVASPGEDVREPDLAGLGSDVPASAALAYGLESTTAKLWPGLADGTLVGDGGLLDGGLPFRSRWITIDVPRYYEADRFSGPFGPDRGIAPFALDYDFGEGEVGALFFDPAARHAECLVVPRPWSLEYEAYPFTR